MKKICISFNHFQQSDGVCRAAINMCNSIVRYRNDIEITLRPIFVFDKNILDTVDNRIKIKPVFGFYFKGFSKIMYLFPKKFLHDLIFKYKYYDYEIGYQAGVSTVAVVASDYCKNKAIVWMHGYDFKLEYSNAYELAYKVVCICEEHMIKLKNELSNLNNACYLYNFYDLNDIILKSNKKCRNIRNKCLTFISVARFSPEKGFVRLIKVFGEIKKLGYVFKLYLIGNGSEKNNIINVIAENELFNEVILLGEKNNPYCYMKQADLFVSSSFHEGYQTAVVESLILGVPFISTNVGGIHEIFRDAQCGMIVENDSKSLCNGIKYILDNYCLLDSWRKILSNTKSNFNSHHKILKLNNLLNL